MQITTPLKLAFSFSFSFSFAFAAVILPQPAIATATATTWSFTFYDAEGCGNSTTTTITTTNSVVEGSGDVACAAVPDAHLSRSIRGAFIPAGAGACAIHFYTDGACGSRLAYGLTGRATGRCLSLAGATTPLRSYQALGCGG
ncbi:hypothetical protein F5X99DRAFT_407278 [Biscogniauxia marginata]|nr:hypothetical protein F5X99DRAFT_407278 [Biscogniauxia marginata]